MKDSIIKLFKSSPVSGGFLLLLVVFHLSGVKQLQTPLIERKEILIFFFAYLCIMVAWLFALPKIKQQKREKMTWSIVGGSILLLTIIAKVFVS